MHELSIAADILDVVEQNVGPERHVLSVRLLLGALSGISAESLQFCFTELAEGAGLGRPELVISEVPAQVKCRVCDMPHPATDFTIGCPNCGSLDREILSGYECVVETLTLQED
jgi:hydrogenase nickel incorporation protein HypA/HybF